MSDPARGSTAARLLGTAVVALIGYATLCAAVLLVSLVLLQQRITPDLPWISRVQRRLYHWGLMHTWQAQPDCVSFDPGLIYRPREGSCRFTNAEFDTHLNFAADGRHTGAKPPGRGIVVIGDSHAMGWGVEDRETFAARLQELSGRPVYNLAVSSYGTVRELMRLRQSGLLDSVDIILIQYCFNDRKENLGFRPPSPEEARQKFDLITRDDPASRSSGLGILGKAWWLTFRTPFSGPWRARSPEEVMDFAPHYGPFADVLSRYPELGTKRVIVFYINGNGRRFRGFHAGTGAELPNVELVDLDLDPDNFYPIDGHMTSVGHRQAAQRLYALIQPR